MQRVDLGPLHVTRLCLGTMLMGGARRPTRRTACSTPSSTAGRNFLDTADIYGDGDLRGDAGAVAGAPPRRGRARHQGALRRLRPRRRRASRPTASARPATRRLRRLGVDVIDLYQVHAPDPDVAAGGHARGARRPRARRQGARARRLELPGLAAGLGGRAAGPRRLVAVRLAAAAVLARRALDRDRAPAVLPRRRARRAAVGAARRRLPHRPLLARRARRRRARAWATPPTTSRRRLDAPRATERNFRAVDEARAIADELGATRRAGRARLAAGQPGVTAPIVGPRTFEQLEDLLGAAELTLDDEQFERLGRRTAPPAATPSACSSSRAGSTSAASALRR